MHWPMAGNAGRCVFIACGGRLPMDALPEFLHFIGVALGALRRSYLGCSRNFVMVAMAGLAGSVAESAMNTIGKMGSLVGVARRAAYLRYFGRVRIILDGAVAVGAAKNAVDAGCMLARINRDALALLGGHSCLAVARQTTFVLLQGLWRRSLCPSTGVGRDAD
jgi:hypothetical protein